MDARTDSSPAAASRGLIGETSVPGDKSTTQRALLLGAVAEGETVARGALRADDTLATAAVVASLGAQVAWEAGDDLLRVRGVDPLASPEQALDCRNAGTAARLLLGLLAGRSGRWLVDGDASLRARPMSRVTEPLAAMGAALRGDRLPLRVEGAPLHGGRIEVELPSAQVKSALLLAGLVADGPTTVVQHIPTRDHTERMLPRFGIRTEVDPGEVTVHPGRPRGATLSVPGDPSSAAFLVVAALLLPGSDLILRDIGLWPRRTGFLDVLEHAGADVMITRRESEGRAADSDPRGDLRVGGSGLTAFEIAPEQVPDLVDEVPILALAAARARGTSRIAGLSELRLKESDRVAGIARLLTALGVPVELSDDSLAITGVEAFKRPSRPLESEDHRLALTAAVGCLASGWPLPPLAAAEVSFPGFAECVASLAHAARE